MRHDSLKDRENFDTVDVAAVWPATAQVAPLPIPDVAGEAQPDFAVSTPAVPDVPAAAGLMIAGTYVALLAALAVATVGSGKSILAIAIAFFFVLMFFSVPAVFFGVERDEHGRRSFSTFMEQGMQTLTGHNSGGAALVQMLLVPAALTFGVICMGIAAAFIF
jgi:hypothetical protein